MAGNGALLQFPPFSTITKVSVDKTALDDVALFAAFLASGERVPL